MLHLVVQYQLKEKQYSRLKLEEMISNLIQWRKNGTNLKNGRNYSGTDTDRLRTQQVKSDAGYYGCLLSNEMKKYGILSEEAHLSVCKFKLKWIQLEIIEHKSTNLVFSILVRVS